LCINWKLEHACDFALARDELFLVYQTMVDIQAKTKLLGAESPVTLGSPELG